MLDCPLLVKINFPLTAPVSLIPVGGHGYLVLADMSRAFWFNTKLQFRATFVMLSKYISLLFKGGFVYQMINSFEVKSHCLVSLTIQSIILAASRFTRMYCVDGYEPLFKEVKISKSWWRLQETFNLKKLELSEWRFIFSCLTFHIQYRRECCWCYHQNISRLQQLIAILIAIILVQAPSSLMWVIEIIS